MNYELLDDKPFAEGGFARLYRAKHTTLDTLVCLKENKNATKDDVALLRAEARLLWRLDGFHSIPTVHDYIELEPTHAFTVLSYIDGKTVHDITEKRGSMVPEDAAWITERLLAALKYVHAHGIIHGDVKPQNVIVEPKKSDIKLIDFGLSIDKPTGKSSAIGYTPHYAPPELMGNKPPIPESDIYGAGVVLIHALGGSISPRVYPTAVPDSLITFAEQLLDENPLKRPSWERDDPQRMLSDIREAVFGRRHRK